MDVITDMIIQHAKEIGNFSADEIELEAKKATMLSGYAKDMVEVAKAENQHIATVGLTYLNGGVFHRPDEPRVPIGVTEGKKGAKGLLADEFNRGTVKD